MRAFPPRLAGLLLLPLVALTHSPGQAAAKPELEALRQEGQRHLEDFHYEAALAAFDAIVAAYDAGALDPWEPEDLALLAEAFEGRAVAHLGEGDLDAVRVDLEAALDAHPGFAPDRERNSPRLIELFEQIRNRRIGWLSVRSTPSGGSVSIEGHRIGNTPMDEVPWYAGEVRVRIERAGHDPWIGVAELPAGGTRHLEPRLVPNARTVILRTSPPGVSVRLDGASMAVSEGPAEEVEASRRGLRPEQLSREVFLQHLPPGRHLLQLEKACHLSRELSVDVQVSASDNRPLLLEPIVLERAISHLEVASRPVGAAVTIDGVDAGRTPLVLSAACAGQRRIEVRGGQRGLWSGLVELPRDGQRRLDVILLPTLLFAGVRAEDRAAAAELHATIASELAAVEGYNLLRLDGATPPGTVEGLTKLLEEHGADLGLAAELHPGAVHPLVELTLVSRQVDIPELAWIDGDPTDGIARFVDRLRRPTEVLGPWLGLVPVDSRLDEGPVIGRLFADGPAHLAGLLVGDRIVGAGGEPVHQAADLDRVLASSTAEMALQVRRGDEERSFRVLPGVTPVLLPPGDPDRSYHKLLVDLWYLPDRDTRPQVAVAARLNRALALLHLGRCDLALQHPLGAGEMPEGPGIGAGTMEYLRGLCYERLGPRYRDEAREAFAAAAARQETTLRTHDGPLLAPMARRHQEALGG